MECKLDCDAFANAHSSDSHYDKQSFVGLAWRPQGESICAEAYSTGKCNLPGSRRERDMLRSWARMAPELYMHSSRQAMALKFEKSIRERHKQTNDAQRPADGSRSKKQKNAPTSLWEEADEEGWDGSGEVVQQGVDFFGDDEMLDSFGDGGNSAALFDGVF